jgi:hypothetical protein
MNSHEAEPFSNTEAMPDEKREQLLGAIDSEELRHRRDAAMDEIFAYDIDYKEAAELATQVVDRLKNELLAQADRFDKIFVTESGSYYFVAGDGASLRLQMAAEGYKKITPVVLNQIFVDGETGGELLPTLNHPEELVGQPIRKQPYAIGMQPFEFGISGMPNIRCEDNENTLTMLGDDHGGNHSGFHLGHKIAHIIR